MKKRLQTIISQSGASSRRHAAELIEKGKVSVDGRPVREKGLRLDPDEHSIVADGKPVSREEKHYFLFNKPGEVISTAKDTHGRRKITDFFAGVNARLYPVGRLDKDTTGLIIVTNDGELTHRLSHPSFGIYKEYVVSVEGEVSREDISRLSKGVDIDGKTSLPCRIKAINTTKRETVLNIRIHEGRKRQLKRMLQAVGKTVTGIDRIAYGALTLGGLKRGEFRRLSEEEVEGLKFA